MNYLLIKDEIAEHNVQLIVVSKNRLWSELAPIYQAGCRDFGENRIQEALIKKQHAPQDIKWHFIGNLQKNKVRQAVGQFALIHSVDSPELAKKISEVSQEKGLITKVLLQVNCSGELSKQGLSPSAWHHAFESCIKLPGISIQGLMTMAPLTEDEGLIRACFRQLRLFRDQLSADYQAALPELSMGMSHDYKIAIEEGATILRVGTAIFAI